MPSDVEVARRLLMSAPVAAPRDEGDLAAARMILGLAGAPTAAAPEEDPGLGGMYRRNVVSPARGVLDKLMSLGPAPVQSDARDLISAIAVPGTLPEAGATLATMLVPEAKLAQVIGSGARNAPWARNAATRIAAPTAGGAIGGFAEKGAVEDALIGSALGPVFGVPAEAAAYLRKWTATSGLARRLMKEDPERVGKVVNRLIPEFPNLRTPEEFGENIWRGLAKDSLSDVYGKEFAAISREVAAARPRGSKGAFDVLAANHPVIKPDGSITSPGIRRLQKQGIIGGETSFDDLVMEIKDLRLEGRSSKGDPGISLDARQAQRYARDLSHDLEDAIRISIPKGGREIGERYVSNDRRYARGAEMFRYLKQPGIVDENGIVNMKLLQQQLKEERAVGLSHNFTKEEFKELSDAVFRGGPATVEDIIRRKPRASLNVSGGGDASRASVYADFLDYLRGNQYAGTPDELGLTSKILGIPGTAIYRGPRATQQGLQRGTMGAVDVMNQPEKPISLQIDED